MIDCFLKPHQPDWISELSKDRSKSQVKLNVELQHDLLGNGYSHPIIDFKSFQGTPN
jgi:hypothetical protein